MDEQTDKVRTQNKTGEPREHCQSCGDTAQVLVQTRPAEPGVVIGGPGKGKTRAPAEGACYEEMGPCPWCEAGLWLEFGIGRRRNLKGDLEQYRNPNPPWGQLGYWRGRAPVHG